MFVILHTHSIVEHLYLFTFKISLMTILYFFEGSSQILIKQVQYATKVLLFKASNIVQGNSVS